MAPDGQSQWHAGAQRQHGQRQLCRSGIAWGYYGGYAATRRHPHHTRTVDCQPAAASAKISGNGGSGGLTGGVRVWRRHLQYLSNVTLNDSAVNFNGSARAGPAAAATGQWRWSRHFYRQSTTCRPALPHDHHLYLSGDQTGRPAQQQRRRWRHFPDRYVTPPSRTSRWPMTADIGHTGGGIPTAGVRITSRTPAG